MADYVKCLSTIAFLMLINLALSKTALAQSEILSITGLVEDTHSASSFEGIEKKSQRINSKTKRASILYLHGIGWTQNGDLTADFTNSLSRFYGSEFYGEDRPRSGTRCQQGTYKSGVQIRSSSGTSWFQTDMSNEHLAIVNIGCMDRLIVNRGGDIEFYIYRLFWDNSFWNAFQHGYVGYDDYKYYGDVKTRQNAPASVQPRHQRTAELRHPEIRFLKDNIINYGFSDSALYIGSAGKLMREAVATAICLASKDTDNNSIFFKIGKSSFDESDRLVDKSDACAKTKPNTKKLEFISESMGSRIIFDVLQDSHFSNDDLIIKEILTNSPEVFMLANQIPLIGVGEIQPGYKRERIGSLNSPKAHLIAFSDVNDLLTYELVPFTHQLWLRSYSSDKQGRSHKSRASVTTQKRVEIGKEISDKIGFDITDVRTNFGGFEIGTSPFAESLRIHEEMIKQNAVIQLILCGAENGTVKGTFGNCEK